MKKKFIVQEPVFKTQTLFLCGYSHVEMIKVLKSIGSITELDEEYFSNAGGSQINVETKNNFFRTIWLREFKKTPECIGTAAHEIFHLVVRICDDKGIPLTREENADETGAYLEDFYMRHFIGKLFNKNPNW